MIRLARRALANIRQNILMSLATIAVLVPAALLGYLSLTTGLLLNGSSRTTPTASRYTPPF